MENGGFENGNFDGFKEFLNCSVLSNFKGNNLALNHPLDFGPAPGGGCNFAQLDNPAVEDGLRPEGIAPLAVNMKEYFGLDRSEGNRFIKFGKDKDIPTDGAVLSREIDLKKGKKLLFHWSFFGFDSPPSNDFALFFCEDRAGAVVHEDRLCDIFTLRRIGPKHFTEWASYEWEVEEDFSGTVSWVMANAVRVQQISIWGFPPAGLINPSVLLLDNISII